MTTIMNKTDVLNNIYYSPQHNASFSTSKKLYDAARQIDSTISPKDATDFLLRQFTYTLHKSARKRFQRNRIVVSGPEEQLQADLVDVQMFAPTNDGYKYLLTVIDVFSKKAWVIPLKDKKAGNIVRAFQGILEVIKPFKIQTDRGTEFKNNHLESLMEKNNIKLFFTFDEDVKCAVVERFNRTLKGKMFKYFTATGRRRYIDALTGLVASYNNTIHSATGMTPNSVSPQNKEEVFQRLYGVRDKRQLLMQQTSDKQSYSVGDTVRLRYQLGPLTKSYYPNYTDQIFTIATVIRSSPRITYLIKDWQNNLVGGKFYREELTPVAKDSPYRIDKIIKRDKRNKRVLVQWLNYPVEAATWEPEESLKHLKEGVSL